MTVCIQIQPDLIPNFDDADVLALCDSLKAHRDIIDAFQAESGEDDGPYLNLMFETSQPAKVWALLQTTFYPANPQGDAMRAGSMAMCTGEEGWDDFLLLHHFDENLPLDTLPEA